MLSYIILCSHQYFVFFFYLYGDPRDLHVLTHSFPTRRSSYLRAGCRLEAWIRRERAARPLPDLAVHLLQSADVACRLRPQAAGLDEIAADRDAVCGVFPFRFARQTLAGQIGRTS